MSTTIAFFWGGKRTCSRSLSGLTCSFNWNGDMMRGKVSDLEVYLIIAVSAFSGVPCKRKCNGRDQEILFGLVLVPLSEPILGAS